MEEEIKLIITKHYHEIKALIKIEEAVCGDIPELCDRERIEYLKGVVSAYEHLFPYLKK